MKKKLFSLMLALCMAASVITAIPVSADEVANGVCGDNLTWVLDSSGVLTISGTGSMTSHGWSDYYNGDIETVVIEDGVSSIAEDAFSDCYMLSDITIGSGVTSIGKYAFSGCDSLTSIEIPAGVTAIGSAAFFLCTGLTSIEVDAGNTKYSSADGVLFDKAKQSLIQYPIGKTAEEYSIPESVTVIGVYAFDSCSSLTNVTIPYGVRGISIYAFSGCESLTNIIIPDSVTVIGDAAFSNCSSLESIKISENVTNIGDCTFFDCDSLTGITLPDGVTGIESYAFADCNSLESIVIPDKVTSIGDYAFVNCDTLESVEIPDSVTSVGIYTFADCDSLRTAVIGKGVTGIANRTFISCDSLASVVIPDSVTKIDEYSFYGCNRLTDVYYSGTEAEWNAVTVELYNTPLSSAAVHYNYAPTNEITYDSDNKTIRLRSPGSIDGKVIVAIYNGERFLDSTNYDASAIIDNVEINSSDATIIKILWWDSLENLTPKCGAVKVPVIDN